MILQSAQRGGCRIPIVAVNASKGIAVQTSPIGEVHGGNALRFEGGADALDEVCNHGLHKSTCGCAFQGQKHSPKCFFFATRLRVERTPDQKRETLRAFMAERSKPGEKFNVQRWAKDAGVSKNTLYNFLNGHTEAMDHFTYRKLARAAGVPVHVITGEAPDVPPPTGIAVSGYVEAGYFREAVEWDASKWYAVDVPVPPRFRSLAKALEVKGPSMNKEYPEGSVVVWIDQLDFRPARDGDHVIVYAYSHDDQIEATVKELRVAGGKRWLWPMSHHPDYQQPVNTDTPPDSVREIVIQGIVLGGYKPRIQ